jgi:type IV pilus assembly protein PilE
MNSANRLSYNKAAGMSLIELMVVVVLIGILTTMAMPSYRNYMLKAKRVDAKAALLQLAAAQEKHYLQNNTYTTDMGALRQSPISNYEHFDITVTQADALSFTAEATPRDAQAQDVACTLFSINEMGQKTASGSRPDECWGAN